MLVTLSAARAFIAEHLEPTRGGAAPGLLFAQAIPWPPRLERTHSGKVNSKKARASRGMSAHLQRSCNRDEVHPRSFPSRRDGASCFGEPRIDLPAMAQESMLLERQTLVPASPVRSAQAPSFRWRMRFLCHGPPRTTCRRPAPRELQGFRHPDVGTSPRKHHHGVRRKKPQTSLTSPCDAPSISPSRPRVSAAPLFGLAALPGQGLPRLIAYKPPATTPADTSRRHRTGNPFDRLTHLDSQRRRLKRTGGRQGRRPSASATTPPTTVL